MMSDDQVGLRVAEELRPHGLPNVSIEFTEAPASLLGAVSAEEIDLLIVVDAGRAHRSLPPGECARLDGAALTVIGSGASGIDTHSLDVRNALLLARALGPLPRTVWVYVIGGMRFERGAEMSPRVAASVCRVAECVVADIDIYRLNWDHGEDLTRQEPGRA
jgi:hydrogenase maturation protease